MPRGQRPKPIALEIVEGDPRRLGKNKLLEKKLLAEKLLVHLTRRFLTQRFQTQRFQVKKLRKVNPVLQLSNNLKVLKEWKKAQ